MPLQLLNPDQVFHLLSVLALLLDERSRLAGELPHEPWDAPARAPALDQIAHAFGRLSRAAGEREIV